MTGDGEYIPGGGPIRVAHEQLSESEWRAEINLAFHRLFKEEIPKIYGSERDSEVEPDGVDECVAKGGSD